MMEQNVVIHGHTIRYRSAGKGPVVVLLHGITHSSQTWSDVIAPLSESCTVIAPDFLGHGASAKPVGDYSLGEHASMIRDLLFFLGHRRATVIGHSLGGGVAMQFVYQYPEMCERLALVSSGGLGRELNPVLRLAVLPGSEWVMPWVCSRGLRVTIASLGRVLGLAGLRGGTDLRELWRGYQSLLDPEARMAFLHTLRGVIDIGGQRVSALNRLYLVEELPTLIVWGETDALIPVQHAHTAHAAVANSRLEIFEQAGHFPHIDCPDRFVAALVEFIRETQPAQLDAIQFCALAQKRSQVPPSLPAERELRELPEPRLSEAQSFG
jgi:pimeloyl-ACP methyl ester carboxylesterase